MTTSLAERIKQYDDFVYESVAVPEWGGVELEIYGMDGLTRAKYLKAAQTEDGEVDFESIYPELIIATAHEPRADGETEPTRRKVFDPSDRAWLNSKSAKALERLAKVAMRLSGINDSEDELGKPSSLGTQASTES